MHLYLYDSFLYTQNHSKKLDRVESRLTDLGLGGVSIVIDSTEKTTLLVEKELKLGINTVIIVGNDETITNGLNIINRVNPNILQIHNISLAVIPFGGSNAIGGVLGVGSDEKACEILAQRRLMQLDVGIVNNDVYFFNKTSFLCRSACSLKIDDSIEVSVEEGTRVGIYNLPHFGQTKVPGGRKVVSNPSDGFFEIIIETPTSGWGLFGKAPNITIMRGRKIQINDKQDGNIDDFIDYTDLHLVKNLKCKLDFVVGKGRLF